VIAGPAAAQTYRNSALTFAGVNLISISDLDANGAAEKVILKVGQGTLQLAGSANLTFDPGFGTGTSEIHMKGTLLALNAALKGVRYIPKTNTAGSDSLQISVDDGGNPGGAKSVVTKAVNLTVVARPPVVSSPLLYQATRDRTLTVLVATGLLATARSPDLAPLSVVLVGQAPAGLQLAADGSFVYTPPAKFIGEVDFVVQVNDGILLSKTIVVKIIVTTGGRGRG
jgi:hypothetical protein